MKLKVGDVVEFKNYEDITDDENMWIGKKFFPLSGKVKEINVSDCDRYFRITGSKYIFSKESVARVISDVDDCDLGVIRKGDEVLVKVNIKGVFVDKVRISSQIKKTDIVKILKRKEPEHFIVKEDYYGMYIGLTRELVPNKIDAKIYTSCNTANEDAADMHLNAWEVLPYDD